MESYEAFNEGSNVDETAKNAHKNKNEGGQETLHLTVDEVMERIGVGTFQQCVFVICGLSFMADAVEVSLLSFLAECLELEWDLSDVQKSTLTSVVFVGQLFGSYFWGPFADKKGRKWAYIMALSIIVIAGYGSAFARDFPSLVVMRFFVGVGVGAIHIPFDIMAEFLPSSARGNFLLGIQVFWSLGNVLVTLWAWMVLQSYGWRVMAFGCAVPMNISLFGAVFMPESPRWLVSQGRGEEAKAALLQASKMNGKAIADFTLKGVSDDNEGSLTDLIDPKYLKLNALIWTVWFTYGFVYYGIILFTTRIFAHDDDDDNADDDVTCSFDYLHLLISALVEFIALFAVYLGVEKIARNLFQTYFYGLSAIFCALFAFISSNTVMTTLFSSSIRLAVRGGLTVTWIANPELYPTHIRSTGHAISSSMVRLAGVVCPFLASNESVAEAVVCIILCAVSVIAAISSWNTPDTRYADLDNNDVDKIAEANTSENYTNDKAKLLVVNSDRRPSWENLLH